MAKTVRYYNLTGGLNTSFGLGTINSSPNRTEAVEMNNVEYYKLSGLKSMEGNLQVFNTLSERITLGYDYIKGNTHHLIVCTKAGHVYINNNVSNTFDLIYTFPSQTNRHSACNFNNGIVISNGADDLVYYQYGRHKQMTGTIAGTVGSNTIVGTDTKFTTELHKGDYIEVSDNGTTQTFVIDTITDNTHLTTTENVATLFDNDNFYLGPLSLCDATYNNSKDANISNPVRGLALNSYKGRLFVGGNDNILYYSELGKYNGWDLQNDAGAIPEFYNDSSNFTALGLWAENLVIHKAENTYLLDGTDSNTSNWSLIPRSIYSCDSQQSLCIANNGYYIYSQKMGGILPLLQRTIYNSGYQGTEISTKIKDTFDKLNIGELSNIFIVYHPRKKYVMFYMPMLDGIGSNTCFIYDTLTKSFIVRTVPQEVSMAFEYKDEVYIGTADGKILKEFSGGTFDGKPIQFTWKSPWFSYGDGTNYLSCQEFRIKLSKDYTNNFILSNRRNGEDSSTTRKINTSYGSFQALVWDTGYTYTDLVSNYPTTITSYAVTDGTNTYYTKVSGTSGTNVATGTKLYTDKELTTVYGFVGNIVKLNPATQDTSTYAERVRNTGYTYTFSHDEFRKFTNGTDKLWVDWVDYIPIKGKTCWINKVPSTTVGYYGFWITMPSGNPGNPVLTKLVYASPTSKTGNYFNVLNADGSVVSNLTIGGSSNLTDCKILYFTGHQLGTATYDSTRNIMVASTTTGTSDNAYDGTLSSILSVTETSTGVYTVETNNGTFTGLTNPTDSGEAIEIIAYANTNAIVTGTTIYGDSQLTKQIGMGNTLTSGYNAIYSSNGANINLTLGNSYYFYTYNYYKEEVTTFSYNGTTSQVSNPVAIILPSANDYATASITDSVWDTYSWVVTGHQVKRFPLANSIFQSIQLEFSGTTSEQGMAIYGFEIDGLELEEVPY
jgi:hypothetical protein